MDHIENASNNFSIVTCVFIVAATFPPRRFLATTGSIHIQTHKLIGGIYEAHRWNGFRCHDIHTKCDEVWFKHSNLMGGRNTQTHRQHGDLISRLLFYKISRLTNNLRGCNVGITDGTNLWGTPLKCPQCHDIHTKFYDDLFRQSSNIKVTASTIWEAPMLVLLMGGIYEVLLEIVAWHTYQISWRLVHAFAQYYGFSSAIREAVILVLLMGGTYELRS
jgi:hypothetical protein